ncbi:MAG: hypothetical protein ACOC0P_02580 [Planctomycetota bacterium]
MPSQSGSSSSSPAPKHAARSNGASASAASLSGLTDFNWERQPKGQALINEFVDLFLDRCPRARELKERMLNDTSTRFTDWIDYIRVPEEADTIDRLLDAGFTHRPLPGATQRYVHEGAMFPPVILGEGGLRRVGIKVDWVSDFLATWQIPNDIQVSGDPLTQLRRAVAFSGDNADLVAVERHGTRHFTEGQSDPRRAVAALRHLEAFRRRRRDFPNEEQGFAHTHALIDAAIDDLTAGGPGGGSGVHYACDLFFHAERDYWQRRNTAARWQKARQDSLGLGWANHDHHTYRCSRKWFPHLISVLEKLGFYCRERFYAGEEAGWGAQVLEQPVTGFVIFADVDLSAEEIEGDIAHTGLADRDDELGTVGLWTALHGESFLQAGMHHLECQFDHDHLTQSLEGAGHKVMAPFTNFEFLRQAFTQGEQWPVSEKRIAPLLKKGLITEEQANAFRTKGAVGSHLENLERNDGYKGFNQTGVSDIIRRTDARLATAEA